MTRLEICLFYTFSRSLKWSSNVFRSELIIILLQVKVAQVGLTALALGNILRRSDLTDRNLLLKYE